jgi:hypothetical protein
VKIDIEFTPEQEARFMRFREKHMRKCGADSFGTWMQWIITPSCMGPSIKAVCLCLDGDIDLTIDDDGEFILEEG